MKKKLGWSNCFKGAEGVEMKKKSLAGLIDARILMVRKRKRKIWLAIGLGLNASSVVGVWK